MQLRYISVAAVAAGIGMLSACGDVLSVTNRTQPDVDRILSTADGIEGLFRSAFQQIHSATNGSSTSITPALLSMAGESYATVANFGMAQYSAIPRAVIANGRGNQTAAENFRDFSLLQRYTRNASNGIKALDGFIEAGGSLGGPMENVRARAWGFFIMGVGLGNVSLTYDQASIPAPSMEGSEIPDLVPYGEVNAAALAYLDSAIAQANRPEAAALSIPNDWFRTTAGATSRADFIKVIRSYKARFRAGVARTPAERDAVNWNEVAADAAAGITSDIVLDLNSNAGLTNPWLSQALVNSTWSSVNPIYMGMADTSGNYRRWIADPLEDLNSSARQVGGNPGAFFLFHTPDTRFPHGATRADQIDDWDTHVEEDGMPTTYLRARAPGDDTQGQVWGQSPYDIVRFYAYRANSSNGPWVLMDADEIGMLRAEADMRLNPGAPAIALELVNASRTAHGLPAFPAGSSRDTRAPNHPGGGSFSCVPQAPTGGNRVVECGTLWEAMKYEKRLETLYTGYAQWFVDSRGWGDLVRGTPTMYPVPYQEMDARVLPFYNSEWAAAVGTYDF